MDDTLWEFPKGLAILLAVMILAFGHSLGYPISWSKLQFGPEILWTGWDIHLQLQFFSLTEQKQKKVTEFLLSLVKSQRIERKVLEQGVGLLQWVTLLVPFMRPWLADLYGPLYAPTLEVVRCNTAQWSEVLTLLDDNLTLKSNPGRINARQGQRLHMVDNVEVRSVDQARERVASGRGTVWAKFLNFSPHWIRIKPPLKAAAQTWIAHLSATASAAAILTPAMSDDNSAADAWAQGDNAGIGGWYSPLQSPNIGDIFWFHASIHKKDIPQEVEDLQRMIASLETLAQGARIVVTQHLVLDAVY